MGRREELDSANSIVKGILMKDVKARNSDAYLYMKVIEKLNKGSSKMPFYELMKNVKEMGLPCYDTVTRIRRRMQEKYPELKGSEKVTELRKENEKAYRDYARS